MKHVEGHTFLYMIPNWIPDRIPLVVGLNIFYIFVFVNVFPIPKDPKQWHEPILRTLNTSCR